MHWWIWSRTIYTCTLLTIALSVLMAVMMIAKATSPFYHIMEYPKKMQEGNLSRYRTDKTSSRIYAIIDEAVNSISRHNYADAEDKILEAQQLDPENSLFCYMLASLRFNTDDYTHMWRLIRSGNKLGPIHLYCSKYVAPEAWSHPELPVIRQMATVMSRTISTDENIWEIIKMAHNIALCDPADPDVFFSGMTIRESAVEKLDRLAKYEGNKALTERCSALMEEKQVINDKFTDILTGSAFKHFDLPTMVMAMSSYRRNPRTRTAIWIAALEKQAEVVGEMRKRVLKAPVQDFPH